MAGVHLPPPRQAVVRTADQHGAKQAGPTNGRRTAHGTGRRVLCVPGAPPHSQESLWPQTEGTSATLQLTRLVAALPGEVAAKDAEEAALVHPRHGEGVVCHQAQ